MFFCPQCFHERRPSLVPNEVVYRQCQNVDELSVVYCSADPVVVVVVVVVVLVVVLVVVVLVVVLVVVVVVVVVVVGVGVGGSRS